MQAGISARGMQAPFRDLTRLKIDQVCRLCSTAAQMRLHNSRPSPPKLGEPARTAPDTAPTARRENDRASTVGHQNTQGPLPIYPPLLGGSTTAIVRRCAHGLPRALQGLPPSHARRPLRAVSTATPPRGATGSDIVHKTSI